MTSHLSDIQLKEQFRIFELGLYEVRIHSYCIRYSRWLDTGWSGTQKLGSVAMDGGQQQNIL